MQIPRGKARKTPFAEMSHCIGHFNHSKKWEPVAIHMLLSISSTTTLEAITQIKKQRTRLILEQNDGMVETRKARRTDLKSVKLFKQDSKYQSNPKLFFCF